MNGSHAFRDNLPRNNYVQWISRTPYTIALGINENGAIVGFYEDQAGVQHGFLFTN
jgi:probable HAF family extracellular repeat protein